MTRTLYRLYLYVMCTALLIFAAFELGSLLNTLLLLTPLRSAYEPLPDRGTLVQSSVLAVIALLLSAGVGGFHYWLIRRDLAQDATAASSTVRSLVLNLVQAAAALVALNTGLSAIQSVANWQDYSGQTIAVAMCIVSIMVFALVQFERARTRPSPGIWQRIHVYGVATAILITALVVAGRAIDHSIQVFMIATKAFPYSCVVPAASKAVAFVPCDYSAGLGAEWLQTLWVALALTLYRWLASGDARSVLRQIAVYLGFVAGLVSVVVGVERASEVTLRWAMHTGDGFAIEFAYQYAFVGLVALGSVVMAAYAAELLAGSGVTRLGRQGTELTLLAVAAAISGIPFYVGVAQIGRGLLELWVRDTPLSSAEWALALALLIAGSAHVALAYMLRARTPGEAPIAPRRAYTLGALAAGGLTATIGGAMGLYIVITTALGSPIGTQWGLDARTALVNTLVGLFIAGLHLWRYFEQRRAEPQGVPAAIANPTAVPAAPVRVAAPAPSSAPAPISNTAVDHVGTVLDMLLAGHITRDQAAEQLRPLLPADEGAREEVLVR